jgi:hypothetical protein
MVTRWARKLRLLQKANFYREPPRLYMLCGWRTYSEIPLTGVATLVDDVDKNIDVMIQVMTGHSPIAKSMDRFVFRHATECSFISVEDVASFEIRAGRQIRVWPVEGAMQKDIEIFLLGPAWAILCHQRGLLPLHASAIVTGKGITAFAGHSGTGKSTTAALLNSLGYELIADDILPVSFNQNSIPGAWPYLRRLKLHRDPITQFAFTATEVVSETLDKEKYFVHAQGAGDDKWRVLERLYLLEKDVADSNVPIQQITGAEAVRALVAHTYHFNFVLDTRRFGDHLASCSRLASKILIYRLRRPPSRDWGEKLPSLIRTHIEGAGGAGAWPVRYDE